MARNVRCWLGALLLLSSLAITVSGCRDEEFAGRIREFQAGVDLTATAIGTYYLELNEFERELYLQSRLLDSTQTVDWEEPDRSVPSKSVPTPLAGKTFNAKSIKARTDAIQLLGAYGRSLAELAGSDAPSRFAAASLALNEDFGRLGATFDSLKLTADSTAQKFVAPLGLLSTIFGMTGQYLQEQKSDSALTRAVQDAAPHVRAITDLLQQDLETVIGPQRLTGTTEALATWVDYYNNHREGTSLEERRLILDEIRRAQARYDLVVAFNPSEVIGSLRDAHEALVKYATSNRKGKNLAALVGAMEVFRERAEVIAAAVLRFRNLKEGTP